MFRRWWEIGSFTFYPPLSCAPSKVALQQEFLVLFTLKNQENPVQIVATYEQEQYMQIAQPFHFESSQTYLYITRTEY